MVILAKEQISSEVIKISSDSGSAFFLRTDYLEKVNPSEIVLEAEFSDEKEDDIIDAGLSYSAEVKAEEYLARCEQSRSGLARKLLNKKYEKQHIEKALDFLEEKGFLSDYRFSKAWLSSRLLNHFEGRKRLSLELLNRGVKKEEANRALDEFFSENPEEELCRKCYEKLLSKKNKTEENIIRSMLDKGFSYSLVKKCINTLDT